MCIDPLTSCTAVEGLRGVLFKTVSAFGTAFLQILKKERILGFWFNTKRVIYKNLPTLFFISSSKPVEDILSKESIIKEKLYFNELLVNAITQRDFIDQKKLAKWNKNLVDLKFSENLFKEYEFQNVNNNFLYLMLKYYYK